MISIDEAQILLDEIAGELPEAFFQRLNGGICLLPDARRNPLGRNGELYILGMYHAGGPMGRYIEIFYGSIQRAFAHADREQMRHQLREVLLHEFTHHIESLAGERGLEIKDMEFMRGYLQQ